MTNKPLDKEEYIEQAYFFRVFRERLEENVPAQETLQMIQEEILATTKLPLAIDFMRAEIMLHGRMGPAMQKLSHYFAPFQAFVMIQAEEERQRFDQKLALQILEKEAEYRAGDPKMAGLFIYQFECIARNRLGYSRGLLAVADDPMYDDAWRDWIHKVRVDLGTVDFADLLYFRSEQYVIEKRRRTGNPDYQPSYPILFGAQEGRIARAHRGRDPLYMFAALQRHLNYPAVPRIKPRSESLKLHPLLEQRLQKIEQSIKVLQMEVKGGDLSEFYVRPDASGPETGPATSDGPER